ASDRRVFRFKAFTHPSRQVLICALVEIATTDAGLVGDDNDPPAQLVGPKAGQLENSRNELELARFWTNELRRRIVVITNQSGIGRGNFDERAYQDLTRWM